MCGGESAGERTGVADLKDDIGASRPCESNGACHGMAAEVLIGCPPLDIDRGWAPTSCVRDITSLRRSRHDF